MSISDKQALVSVIVLSFNHENFIERAIQSVVNQNYLHYEIIYIDNDSSDQSYEKGIKILSKSGVSYYAEKTIKNLGIANGFNHGINFSKSKYISILAGDDWWDMDNLKFKVAYITDNPEFGMVYGNGYSYNDDTQEMSIFYTKPFLEGFIFKELLKGPTINPQGILFNHDLIKSIGYYDSKAKVEDRDLWLRIAQISKIGYVHRALTFYRVNHGNNISSNIEYMRTGNEYFFKKYEREYPNEVKEARVKQYQFFAYSLAEKKPGWNSLKFMLKNYQFDYLYNKQILKCILNMIK